MQAAEKQMFPMREAYAFARAHGLERDAAEIREMEIEWDRAWTTTVRRGRIIALFERNNVLQQFVEEVWLTGQTARGNLEIQRCKRIYAEYESFIATGVEEAQVIEDEPVDRFQFALEAHLRDFLARNLEALESGLRLYDKHDLQGIEFPVDAGRIDLLAVDRSGTFVVIELKLSRGRNAALGQLLYYMGWVDQHLGGTCRGIIVANEITKELAIAVSRASSVSLFRYTMSFAVETVR